MSRSHALANPSRSPSLRDLAATVLNALRLHRSRQRLAALEPHMLRDIGMTPDQALHEATRPLWDAPKTWLQRD